MADLVVLGNGFDLNVGMRTRYSDYFSTIEKEGIVEKYCMEFDADLLSTETLVTFDPKYSSITFWDIVFFILKEAQFKNWSEVEYAIFEIVNIGDQSSWEDYQNSGYMHDFINYLRTKNYHNIHYTRALHNFCLRSMISKENMHEFQLKELIKFEKKFANYILEQKALITEEIEEKIKNLFYDILETSDYYGSNMQWTTSILNFNYTGAVFRNLYRGEGTGKNLFTSIHGLATGDIIFGIEETAIEPDKSIEMNSDSSIYSFTKTARVFRSPQVTSNLYKTALPPNVSNVRFYGHSLGTFDYSYFQSIFDHYNLYDSNLNLKFFYSVYQESEEEDIVRKQSSSILKLLKTYGSTLDNKDHGRNLIHKMMLEGRLKMIRLPKSDDVLEQERLDKFY